jgi:hypothetical protein
VLGALVSSLALGLIAVPAAHAACAATPTSKAFAAFGDQADYSLAPGGSFESGTSGWSLNGASVVSGNESFKVRSASDAKSLAINAKGTAVSAPVCVSIVHPTFRFFARRTSGTWGALTVKLRWTDASNVTRETVVGSVNGSDTAWHPSAVLNLAPNLGIWNGDQAMTVRFVFDPEDYGGAWAIDDVFVDPYSRT